MKVFKFGGASVNSVERIQNLAGIVKSHQDQPLVIIISAMGKTTNSLEKVAESFYAGNRNEALQLFDVVKQHHLNMSKYLLVKQFNECLLQLTDFFTEVEWLLHDKPVREYDYYYDQVVCIGELLSTAIISHYLNESGISNEWLDVRDLLRTDNTFRDAAVDWDYTSERVKHTVSRPGIYLTQGFIGCTADNESTTLGREGSDFTAAIFANILNAESLTIWKDVEAVMSADPKRFPDAQPLQELNFTEVIEMAYYGAQVIHPKTIKPLQNKGIPLHVKCFLNPELPGTLIHKKNSKGLPPIIVVKENQALLHLNSQDFSFVGEEPMSWLYALLHKIKTRPNLIQTGAINVQLCMDYRAEKIEQLAAAAAALFDVQVEKDLTLLTIRHYNTETFEQLTRGKEIVLTQRTVDTVQVLIRQ
ncbi:MAG: aspartate kinase [Chitinophagaceae bacterium]|nr:aspartate kinase [Chitinophagaceae bacterium]MCA6457554.1 aspartate kinase [Chitinophagaceae bacterium]MCA6463268.1 aspartate kinase [Chitinophagaceae bacterium]